MRTQFQAAQRALKAADAHIHSHLECPTPPREDLTASLQTAVEALSDFMSCTGDLPQHAELVAAGMNFSLNVGRVEAAALLQVPLDPSFQELASTPLQVVQGMKDSFE